MKARSTARTCSENRKKSSAVSTCASTSPAIRKSVRSCRASTPLQRPSKASRAAEASAGADGRHRAVAHTQGRLPIGTPDRAIALHAGIEPPLREAAAAAIRRSSRNQSEALSSRPTWYRSRGGMEWERALLSLEKYGYSSSPFTVIAMVMIIDAIHHHCQPLPSS